VKIICAVSSLLLLISKCSWLLSGPYTNLASSMSASLPLITFHHTYIMPLVDLAVIHGRQGSVQTAVASGKPVIGFPLQTKQRFNPELIQILKGIMMVWFFLKNPVVIFHWRV
jgi:hypothetical protein